MQGRAERHQMYILIFISKNALAQLIQVHKKYFHSRDAKEACIYSLARCQKLNTL